MKILMLDDMCNGYYRLRIAIENDSSISIVFTDTPLEAETALRTGVFDILLLDGYLGSDTYGPDVLRRWISRGLALPPVYMISSDAEMQQKGVEVGAVGSIEKDLILRGDLAGLMSKIESTSAQLFRPLHG